MEESNQKIDPAAFRANAILEAVEHQRAVALTEWARCRADLAVASKVIEEQDAEMARLNARIAELEAQLPKPEASGPPLVVDNDAAGQTTGGGNAA